MTAIAAVYTPRIGFVIGADGRARWTEPEAVSEAKKGMESDQEQKIFEATAKRATIAYALSGTAYNDDKTFSVIAESQKAATSLSDLELANHLEYVQRFCDIVSEKIAEAHAEGRFDYIQPKICAPGHENTLVRILFCGYFRTRPFAYDAEIVNENGTLSCNPLQCDMKNMGPMVLGSEKIAKLMYLDKDPQFRKYSVPIRETSSTLNAIACVRGYLEACSTPLARRIDPFCEIVGGHIHIATVTPQFGFQWSSPPLTKKEL
jgi:hypothetical protein